MTQHTDHEYAGHDSTKPSTTESGAPRESDAHSLSVGADGPLLLHDVALVEKLARFDRERVPERSPHAKGSGAFGELEITHDVSAYTKADFLQPGKKTPMLARFSTVAGELGSPDSWRDVRGFALKFYTEEGNFDMVGNNTPVFFVRDPIKFPDFIHSQKRTPDSGLRSNNMQWDFWSLSPESAHQVAYLMGPRGLPKSWRHMNGYSSHTYMWVNAEGEKFWVQYHFHTDQGVENMTQRGGREARRRGRRTSTAATSSRPSNARRLPVSWTLSACRSCRTRRPRTTASTPSTSRRPGRRRTTPCTACRQASPSMRTPRTTSHRSSRRPSAPANTVPGTGLSPDKMLLGRVFSYPDAQRNRIGTNFNQLPVNAPITQDELLRQGGRRCSTTTRVLHPSTPPTRTAARYQDARRPRSTTAGRRTVTLVRSCLLPARRGRRLRPGTHPGPRGLLRRKQRHRLVETVDRRPHPTEVEEPVLSNVDPVLEEHRRRGRRRPSSPSSKADAPPHLHSNYYLTASQQPCARLLGGRQVVPGCKL
jgi:catalase